MKQKALMIILMSCFFFSANCVASNNSSIGERLDKIVNDYNKIKDPDSVEELGNFVMIDSEIREFLNDVKKSERFHNKYWKNSYGVLGLHINRFTEQFEYNGKFLERAHEIDSHSKYRQYTFFSEINSNEYCFINNVKNIEAAKKYKQEFPEGPFIADVYRILGGFYWSLYNYIRFEKAEIIKIPHDELKYYDAHVNLLQYISSLDIEPIELQEKNAKVNAINYLVKYLKKQELNSEDKEWAEYILNEIRSGSNDRHGVFSCYD